MFKKILLVGSTILFLLIFTFVLLLWMGGRRHVREMRAWIAMGGTFNPAELQPASIPDESNAAVAYHRARRLYLDLPKEEYNVIASRWEADIDDLNRVFSKHEALIDTLRDASSMDQCVWNMGLTPDPLTFDANLSGPNRHLAVIMASRAVLDYEQGDVPEALRDLEATLRISRHMAADPTLIAQLEVLAVEQVVLSDYEKMFSEIPAPDDRIVRLLEPVDFRDRYRTALLAEVPTTEDEMQQMIESHVPSGLQAIASGFFGWDAAYYLAHVRELVESTAKPYDEAPLEYDDESLPFYAARSLSLTSLSRSARPFALVDARVRMLVTAEQLRKFKSEHGRYPAPDEFETPDDPLTGDRFEYEREGGGGFVLRSEATQGRNDEPLTWQWRR